MRSIRYRANLDAVLLSTVPGWCRKRISVWHLSWSQVMRQQMEEGYKAFGQWASRSAERVYPARFLSFQIIPTISIVHDEQHAFAKVPAREALLARRLRDAHQYFLKVADRH